MKARDRDSSNKITAVQSLHFWLSVWTLSSRCPVKAFHFYVVSALQFIVFVFYFWLIRAVSSSYVHQQHFRPRSLAFICHSQNTFQHCYTTYCSDFTQSFALSRTNVFSKFATLAREKAEDKTIDLNDFVSGNIRRDSLSLTQIIVKSDLRFIPR